MLEADRRGALAAVTQVLFMQKELFDDDLSLAAPKPRAPRVPPWQEYLGEVERALKAKSGRRKPPQRSTEILYCIDVPASATKGKIVIELFSRTRKKDGQWTDPKDNRISTDQIASLPDPLDVEVLSTLLGGEDVYSYSSYSTGIANKSLNLPLALKLLPQIAVRGPPVLPGPRSGRVHRAAWDREGPWIFGLELRQDDRDQWTIAGFLRRGEERMALEEPLLLLEDGLMLARDTVSRFELRRRLSAGWRNCATSSAFLFRTGNAMRCSRNCWQCPPFHPWRSTSRCVSKSAKRRPGWACAIPAGAHAASPALRGAVHGGLRRRLDGRHVGKPRRLARRRSASIWCATLAMEQAAREKLSDARHAHGPVPSGFLAAEHQVAAEAWRAS